MVTVCRFVTRADQLLTGSKDTLVKLWDLTTQHCVETLVAHRSEVWTLDVRCVLNGKACGLGTFGISVFHLPFFLPCPLFPVPFFLF